MTGGTAMAGIINKNLVRASGEFGKGRGMVLGPCRQLSFNDGHFADFDFQDLVGDNQPFYANLFITHLEQLLVVGKIALVHEPINKLRANGLIIHINPLQEWF